MKPITISPGSLLLGVLLAVGLFLVMGQAGPSSPPGSWGPPKKSVVNVFEPQAVNIPPGAHHVVYQVPSDRWLTVTAVFADTGLGDGTTRWAELDAGSFNERGLAAPVVAFPAIGGIYDSHTLLSTPEPGGGAVGWVFRPGSQVTIRNSGTAGTTIFRHALIGYESRD